MIWQNALKGRIKLKEPLKKHTSFKIGGPAEIFIQPAGIGDLKLLIGCARRDKIPVVVLGAGSNVLVSDKGVEGIVLKLDAVAFKGVIFSGQRLYAGSGLLLSRLIQESERNSLSGLEFLVGIPGTIGGALAMNAGAWGRSIGDLVEKVKVMDYNGKINLLGREKIKFAYRKSSLARYIILEACLKLNKKAREKIKDDIKRYAGLRLNTQDLSLPNAGCIFRNPRGASQAGKLIDLCGLKGRSMGGAAISMRHANFILNRRNAKAADVLKLMDLMKEKVKEKFSLDLESEIKIWGQK